MSILFVPEISLTKMVVVSSCCGEDCRSLDEELVRLEELDVRRMVMC